MITQTELKSLFEYDENTGLFKRIKNIGNAKIGEIAGTITNKGYVRIRVNINRYLAHRLVWLYIHGNFPKNQIDHINGNRADNRLCNLRECSPYENQWNRKIRDFSESKIKGVKRNKKTNSWEVQITFNKKRLYLGSFKNLDDAKLVIEKARLKYHGEFAKN